MSYTEEITEDNTMKWFRLSPIMLLVFASTLSADMFTPSHGCSKPYKPYQFTAEWEIQNFRNQVSQYKNCIADFVDEQNEAAQAHQEAAEEAIAEWNNFVNYELN